VVYAGDDIGGGELTETERRTVVVIANRTVASSSLLDQVVQKARAGVWRFTFVVPVEGGDHRAAERRLQTALAVAQVALCLALLVGANLMIRSFLSLQHADVGFDDAFTFKYSVRDGTPAVRLAGHVTDEVQGERLERLIAVVRSGAKRKNVALVGTTHEVLVEGRAKRGGLLQARTRTNKVALLDGPDAWIGSYRRVRFTGTTGSTFTAWPVDHASREAEAV